MDTDEEVTNGRVTLLNGNGPPYFHGYLYMKGMHAIRPFYGNVASFIGFKSGLIKSIIRSGSIKA